MTSRANADVLLAGNTHTAFHITLEQQEQGYTIYRHVINPGSVGYPKDEIWHA